MAVNFTTPVGRLVGGSLYKPQDKDPTGKPLTIKNGPDAGKPTVRYWLPLAIPKGTETHWNQTPWGAVIWKVGAEAFPQQHVAPSFAWKVVDGDSTVPNKRGRKPVEGEGYARHWVLNFSGTYAPKAVNNNGSEFHPEPDYIKPGHYIQIGATVAGNNQPGNPGVYLNYSVVSLQGFGAEIISGPDPTAMGFGTAPLPPGASAVPVSGLPGAAPAPQPATMPPVTQVAPNPAFVAPPPAAVPPPAAMTPPPPPAPVGPVMTAKAAGVPYDAFVKQGWTDDQMRAQGYLA